MDRKVLVGVGLVAVVAAVGLGLLLAPNTDVGPVAAPSVAPKPTAPARAAHRPVPVGTPPPSAVAPAPLRTAPSPMGATRSPITPTAAEQARIPASAENLDEQQREYRCKALGQQADLIDRLMVIANGGAVAEDQQHKMVSRVAQMSMRVYDEGEHLWSGALSCDGISDVNLGPAADFLAQMREDMDLDENTQVEVEQALGILDQTQWPDLDEAE